MPHFEHPFVPIFDKQSQALILGTFPSVISRKEKFYYAHLQNRFWKIMAHLTKTEPFPHTIDEKILMLFRNKIALWDIIQSCDILGSSDNSITNVTPVNLSLILKNANIKYIFANGTKAYELYKRYFSKHIVIDVKNLPSTSPANAHYNFEKLIAKWSIIIQR
ncbi:MAG: DNA-deoxyinosine glycosylase [Puniceicoccales bacterium]|jgi:hypoxanthine-DNA glycosylase|nr:DNA-deoxyinosine glycosylase [Puniceicoccales bacterium]